MLSVEKELRILACEGNISREKSGTFTVNIFVFSICGKDLESLLADSCEIVFGHKLGCSDEFDWLPSGVIHPLLNANFSGRVI